MTTAEILILVVVILAAVPGWLLVFRKQGGVSASDLDVRLADQQRQFNDELGRIREGIERVQRELNDGLKLTFETRVDALKSSISDTLTKGRESQDTRLDKVETTLRDLITQFKNAQAELQQKLFETLKTQGEENKNVILTLQERVAKELGELRDQQREASEKLNEGVRVNLEKVSQANEEKLEKIRLTVDEKLHETLEKRLGESFKQVSERLEEVHKGLGEMQNLASGVGDLKRVLSNVRERGTIGEVQLEALLEQVFTPSQYAKNCATIPGSNERVEFALKLPNGPDEQTPLLLPIDAKFPVETRERMDQAIEAGDKEAYALAQKELTRVLLGEAKKIRTKYIGPPYTTDIALMFIPTEGLYAEVLRAPGLVQTMQTEHHVIPVGPTNLFAILSSLQMGFKTLAIEKRSSEVWDVLRAVKTEFEKFGGMLDGVSKKLSEAQNKISQARGKTTTIRRKMKGVESLPELEASTLLGDEGGDGSGAEGAESD
ncbi:DNA recombination protein RmuC [bacterium]|nr:DNA recombination protein RmuC [bacterium]